MVLSQPPAITVADLLSDFIDSSNCPSVSVSGLALDSRLVVAGDLFIAVKGTQTDGVQYIAQAVEKGAAAVLVEQALAASDIPVPVIVMPQLSEYVSDIAGVFYGQPSQHMPITAITGTNGKTTCSQLLAQLFDAAR